MSEHTLSQLVKQLRDKNRILEQALQQANNRIDQLERVLLENGIAAPATKTKKLPHPKIDEDVLDKLDGRGVLSLPLIMLLDGRAEWKFTELLRASGVSQKAFYNAVNLLKELGVVGERHPIPRIGNVRLLRLTEKGTSVAGIVKNIDAVLKEAPAS